MTAGVVCQGSKHDRKLTQCGEVMLHYGTLAWQRTLAQMA